MADLPITLSRQGLRPHARRYPSPAERLAAGIETDPNGGCWLWSGTACPDGYGLIKVRGRSVGVHRLAWTLARGPIPKGAGAHGTCVLHRCDVRACVNPDHLFLGSNQDNMDDMAAKGRKVCVRGEKGGNAKLSEAEARQVRALALAGRHRQADIGARFGIAQSTVMAIKCGRNWGHLAQTGVAPPVPPSS